VTVVLLLHVHQLSNPFNEEKCTQFESAVMLGINQLNISNSNIRASISYIEDTCYTYNVTIFYQSENETTFIASMNDLFKFMVKSFLMTQTNGERLVYFLSYYNLEYALYTWATYYPNMVLRENCELKTWHSVAQASNLTIEPPIIPPST
jgi:hypothetical protein